MKQIIVIFCLALVMASCNNSDTTKTGSDSTTTTMTPASTAPLPYLLQKPYKGWQIADNGNTAAAMSSLKAFVDQDYTALAASFGDSIDISLDYYHDKLSRDSAVSMFKSVRPMYTEINITMYDYESVMSADKADEWVTLWYKQSWKDDKGKADSLNIIDDCKMKDGKMIQLDEKIQHFPVKK